MTLASQILSDIAQLFSDWGDTALYNGGTTPIAGIFDNEYAEIDLGMGAAGSAHPAFICKTSDVSGAAKDYALIVTSLLYNITSVSYKVLKPMVSPSDLGPGFTRLVLKKA